MWLAAPVAVLNVQLAPAAGVLCRGCCGRGHWLYRLRRLNQSDNRGAIRCGNGLDARHRSSYGQAVACPGTVRESAPAGTTTALGAFHKPELRLPCAALLACSRGCRGALSYSERLLHDSTGPELIGVGVRVLWEIKTHQFDTYPDFVRRREIEKELEQIEKEKDAAAACGYDFVVGVSTQAHKDALLRADRFLNVVVTGCKR